jgi:hypothetical protein
LPPPPRPHETAGDSNAESRPTSGPRAPLSRRRPPSPNSMNCTVLTTGTAHEPYNRKTHPIHCGPKTRS